MQNKNNSSKKFWCVLIIGIIVDLIAVIIGAIIIIRTTTNSKSSSKLIFLSETENAIIDDESRVFTSYNELQQVVHTGTVSQNDFNEYNYVLIPISYDACSEKNLEVLGYEVNGNKIIIKTRYESTCGVCAPRYFNYLARVSKSLRAVTVDYENNITKSEECDPLIVYKPIIYLYPEQETEVSVKLGHPEKLTTVYPKYNNGWQVLAQPNGDLVDLNTGRSQYALYWEGADYPAHMHNTGFVVKGVDTSEFLEEKLAILGLSEREANEFILYWLPKMEHNLYNYIYFATSEEIEKYMPLQVKPAPDTIIRVMMEFQPMSEKKEIKEQILTPVERKGFTVVEWGGSKISS